MRKKKKTSHILGGKMKYIFYIIVISSLVLFLFYKLLELRLFILNKRLEYLQKKRAYQAYELIKLSYELLMDLRRSYYQTRFITDSVEREKKQAYYTNAYKECLKVLNNPDIKEHILYLPDKKRREIEEILASPRYELF